MHNKVRGRRTGQQLKPGSIVMDCCKVKSKLGKKMGGKVGK